MATRPIDIGDVGRTVAANVTRYRKRRGYSMRALAEELTTNGRTMSASAISQIENTARRVDVDDLFAIAVALDVTPDLLLMPEAHSGDDRVPSVFGETAAARIWAYLRLDPPPGDPLNEWWVDPQQTPTALMAKLFASLGDDPETQSKAQAGLAGFIGELVEVNTRIREDQAKNRHGGGGDGDD
ncbi:MAG TPA: helix-turn-helix transcriptional regulator [Gordonia sp. (in: high G+C Gram-positive bacteria)]|nr:helix-turn-helix transcriptional regulator [Gordonia sp. (in: high G+C Gram-positive bacteria)]RUP40675.1 MAG: XRE family transcriptional regulator [Gordonia sp. (in: high G+C Gram-positive bacteria)]HNP57521.1 helix-turn-helix transcriptional regulator [Gordonia sp. (in: high G+C Gram-positive bacteria)]HRC51094.1 helix-turn-helix transcriptional regulator [Gordonia sp. (in: high G+C Gram-positive bacteria)]